MKTEFNKIFFDEVEMTTKQETYAEATKIPRTAVVPVIADPLTGYLNAAPYSAGIMSIDPYHILFGVKDWDTKLAFEGITDFVLSIPGKNQLNATWVMANSIPHGISEIDVAGCTELPSRQIKTPGIREFPINFECKKAHLIKLGGALRNLVIAEVIGISMDASILRKSREEVVSSLPIHEAIQHHPYTGVYALSALSGEVEGKWETKPPVPDFDEAEGRVYLSKSQFRDPKYQAVFINALFPRPTYVVMYNDDKGIPKGLPVSGGLIMHTKPAVQIPILKDSEAYKCIKASGKFVVSIPVRRNIGNFENLEKDSCHDVEKAGFHLLTSGQIAVPGIEECPVNVECGVILFEDVPGTNYALLLGAKVGASIDGDIAKAGNYISLYTQYPYSVFDWGMVRKWAFQDDNFLSVLPLPTWGSRSNGGWWGGPEQWQSGFQFWLMELVQSAYLEEAEYHKLKRWISWWRSEGYLAPEPLRSDVRERITKVLNMMCWAHRDFDKWHAVHEYLAEFVYEGTWAC